MDLLIVSNCGMDESQGVIVKHTHKYTHLCAMLILLEQNDTWLPILIIAPFCHLFLYFLSPFVSSLTSVKDDSDEAHTAKLSLSKLLD